jgi:hypothetical protein
MLSHTNRACYRKRNAQGNLIMYSRDDTLLFLSQCFRRAETKVKAGQRGDLDRALIHLQIARDMVEEHARNERDSGYRDDLRDLGEDLTTSAAMLEQWAS